MPWAISGNVIILFIIANPHLREGVLHKQRKEGYE